MSCLGQVLWETRATCPCRAFNFSKMVRFLEKNKDQKGMAKNVTFWVMDALPLPVFLSV